MAERKFLKTLKRRILSAEAKTNTRNIPARRLWNHQFRLYLTGGDMQEDEKKKKLLEVIASYRKKLNDLKEGDFTRKEREKRRNALIKERNLQPLWIEQEAEWKNIRERYNQRKKEIKEKYTSSQERKEKQKENKELWKKEEQEHPLYEEKQLENAETERLILERWENKEEDVVSRKTWAGELSNKEKFEIVNNEFSKSYRWCAEKIKEMYKDIDLGFNKYNSAITTLIEEWQKGKFSSPMRIGGHGDLIVVNMEEYLNSLSKCERELLEENLKKIESFSDKDNYPSPSYTAAICVYPFYTADGEKNMLYQGIHVHPIIFTARRMISYNISDKIPSPTSLLFQKMKAWALEKSITTMYVCPIGGMVQTATKNNTFEEIDRETMKTLKIGDWDISWDFGCGYTSLYKESLEDFAKRIK